MSPTLTLLLSLSAITLVASTGSVSGALAYYDSWWPTAEYWRPLTAWVAQLNVYHWLVNQWGLVLMALLLPPRLERRDWLALAWVWLACSAALAASDYANYVGLSGLLYGWLVWSVWRTPFYPLWLRWAVILVLSGKVALENLAGAETGEPSLVAEFIQANIAVQSHAWGLIAGWCALLVSAGMRQNSPLQRD